MPRFFFDITENEKTVVDPDGHELPSAQKAHDEAVRTATALSMDAATTTCPHVVEVAVCDAKHHVICAATVTFDPGQLEL